MSYANIFMKYRTYFFKFQIPDEMTLGAMAVKYAQELSSVSSHDAPNAQNLAATKIDTTKPISTANWTTHSLPLLEFQQQVLQQLREIWLDERRKFMSGIPSCGPSNSCSSTSASSTNFFSAGAAANPSSICRNDSSSLDGQGAAMLGCNVAEYEFIPSKSVNEQTKSKTISEDQQRKQLCNIVGGYYNASASSVIVSAADASLFSSKSSSNSSNHYGCNINLEHLEKSGGGAICNSGNAIGTPKHSKENNSHQQQSQHYLEPVIIANSPSISTYHNQIHKYQPPPPLATISGYGSDGQQCYRPGIYQVKKHWNTSKFKCNTRRYCSCFMCS